MEPVRFEESVDMAMEQKAEVGIECGGNTALLNMINSKYTNITAIGLLTPKEEKEEVFCKGLIEITKNSKSFCMEKCYAGISFNYVDLPEYPFAGIRDSLFKEFSYNLKHEWSWEELKP